MYYTVTKYEWNLRTRGIGNLENTRSRRVLWHFLVFWDEIFESLFIRPIYSYKQVLQICLYNHGEVFFFENTKRRVFIFALEPKSARALEPGLATLWRHWLYTCREVQ